jgi:hypothetical protein
MKHLATSTYLFISRVKISTYTYTKHISNMPPAALRALYTAPSSTGWPRSEFTYHHLHNHDIKALASILRNNCSRVTLLVASMIIGFVWVIGDLIIS